MKMKLENYQYKTYDNNIINYYEADNDNPILLIIHAQSANSSSYSSVIKDLSRKFHLIIIDYYIFLDILIWMNMDSIVWEPKYIIFCIVYGQQS